MILLPLMIQIDWYWVYWCESIWTDVTSKQVTSHTNSRKRLDKKSRLVLNAVKKKQRFLGKDTNATATWVAKSYAKFSRGREREREREREKERERRVEMRIGSGLPFLPIHPSYRVPAQVSITSSLSLSPSSSSSLPSFLLPTVFQLNNCLKCRYFNSHTHFFLSSPLFFQSYTFDQ